MATDSSSPLPFASKVQTSWRPLQATSRRGFLKALLALVGAFSLNRYFKWTKPPADCRAGSLSRTQTTLADKRVVAYTPSSPLKKTNA